MLQCEYCSKKLYDINPHKWTEYNIKQHKKYCKLKPIAKSKFSIDNFFGKYPLNVINNFIMIN